MTIEELQKRVIELEDSLKESNSKIEALSKANEEYKVKNADLTKINSDLFLRVTTPQAVDKDKDDEEYPTVESQKEFNNKQIYDLREVMKERRR